MLIGIICAMDIEINAMREAMTDVSVQTFSNIEYIKGKLFGKDTVIAKCGIGKVFAALCAQTMILRYQPDLIINSGVAGTLTSELSVCDVALAGAVVQHDMDTSPLGDPVGLISGINVVYINSSAEYTEKLETAAKENGIKTLVGNIASGDQFIASSEKKAYIRDTFGAIACEMEGAAIGQVCYVNGTPFCVLRAISDGGDDDASVDYPTFVKLAAENTFKIIKSFLT